MPSSVSRARSRSRRFVFVLAAAICALPTTSLAATCRVPTLTDIDAMSNAAILQEAMKTIDAMAAQNAHLNALPEARLRNSIVISGVEVDRPRGARININAYSRNAWGPGPCDLIPQADRLGAGGIIWVAINIASAALRQPLGVVDAQLHPFVEPVVTRRIGSLPVYAGRGADVGEWVTLTYDGRAAWEPVTVAEWLGFKARELKRLAGDATDAQADPSSGIDGQSWREGYEALKKTDPAGAEELRKTMLALEQQMPAWQAQREKTLSQGHRQIQAELDQLASYRRSLSAATLASQAVLGTGPFRLATAKDSEVTRQPLVKLSRRFGWETRNPQRMQLLVAAFDHKHPQQAGMRRAFETLDYDRLQALLH